MDQLEIKHLNILKRKFGNYECCYDISFNRSRDWFVGLYYSSKLLFLFNQTKIKRKTLYRYIFIKYYFVALCGD